MKLFRFDSLIAKDKHDYGSIGFKIVRIAHTIDELSIVCIHLGKSGLLARHPAVNNQLFLVVQGGGIVSGYDSIQVSIKEGQAAFWEAGESHETKSQNGLVAIVLEGVNLDPSHFMEELVP